MPVCEADPWRMQYFEHVPCPDDVRIPTEDADAFKSGQVALQMNFAFTWPGLYKDEKVGGDKIGFFPNPEGPKGHFAQLGGQGISVVSYSDHQDAAFQYIKWFAQPDVQKKWWELGGYSCLKVGPLPEASGV